MVVNLLLKERFKFCGPIFPHILDDSYIKVKYRHEKVTDTSMHLLHDSTVDNRGGRTRGGRTHFSSTCAMSGREGNFFFCHHVLRDKFVLVLWSAFCFAEDAHLRASLQLNYHVF